MYKKPSRAKNKYIWRPEAGFEEITRRDWEELNAPMKWKEEQA